MGAAVVSEHADGRTTSFQTVNVVIVDNFHDSSHELTKGWAFKPDCAGFYYSPRPNKYYHMWEMSHGQIMYLFHCL